MEFFLAHLVSLIDNGFLCNFDNVDLLDFHRNLNTVLHHQFLGTNLQRICIFQTNHNIHMLYFKIGYVKND